MAWIVIRDPERIAWLWFKYININLYAKQPFTKLPGLRSSKHVHPKIYT